MKPTSGGARHRIVPAKSKEGATLTTVVFIHGTGVREQSYERSLARVRSELAGREGLTVVPCYWGGLGAVLHQDGASIPRYDATRPAKPETAEEVEVALWGLLYDDPLYELRLLPWGDGGENCGGAAGEARGVKVAGESSKPGAAIAVFRGSSHGAPK